jgi:hypothetical protein
MSEKIWGHVVDGVCVNIVVADDAWVAAQPGEWILSTPENVAWKGAVVTNGIFELYPRLGPLED